MICEESSISSSSSSSEMLRPSRIVHVPVDISSKSACVVLNRVGVECGCVLYRVVALFFGSSKGWTCFLHPENRQQPA